MPISFKPSFKLSIVSIILASILVYLGTWQISRANYKKNFYNQMQQKSTKNPVSIKLLNLQEKNFNNNRFTNVYFDGLFLNNFTFLLDNQMYQHKPGYKVITAVHVQGLDKLILVDRGWIAIGQTRAAIPKLKNITDVKHIVGIINTIPTGIILKKDVFKNTDTWPIVIQNLDYEFISNALQHKIYDFVVQLQTHDLTSYDIIPIEPGVSSNKNISYAVQWYFFAALVIIYYLVTSIKKST